MSEIYDDLYKRFNGLLPIKRENPKRGQSLWYYMMPVKGSDEDNPEYDIIDVPTQDTPNPMINKHHEEYYIWRTCGDDKVRAQHQSRDGQIFSWNNPPQGGHPGEDYNCRCHAEPYVPNDNFKQDIKNKSEKYYTERFLSNNFFDFLAEKESSNDYTKILDDKKGIGAIGKYQFRMPALQETGYIDSKGKWTGKDGIYSVDDFRYNLQVQEKAVRILTDKNYHYMHNYKVLHFLGQNIKGRVADFPITISGMLAASHKEGAKKVAQYLNSLEKDNNEQYYLPYDKLNGDALRSFLAVETRLREFSILDNN